MRPGEQLAVVGPNASGKSLLADMLIGKSLLRSGSLEYAPGLRIRAMAFRDTYGTADANYYYQQRWNMGDQEELPSLDDSLGKVDDTANRDALYREFQLEALRDKPLVYLSSGELRKFMLMKMLLNRPDVLILDNPYIGLDAQTRPMLTHTLEDLIAQGLHLILILSRWDDVPSFVTSIYPMEGRCLGEKVPAEAYKTARELYWTQYPEEGLLSPSERQALASPPHDSSSSWSQSLSDEVVAFNRVSLRYGNRLILDRLDWKVMKGEKWALSGENGSGKSALTSLICADNPQSYACDLRLFGRPRGSGESIWEIKRHIGYISPEMHRAYLKNIPAEDIVASGLHDSIGLYVRPRPEQRDICRFWMRLFGVEALIGRSFLQLSSGEQRLCLLARAFVKDPSLLILDEPLHGLDTYHRRRVKNIIDQFGQREGKTLIMVTHYQEELPSCIQQEIFLKRHTL